jgi:hypothetical protein
MISSGRAPHCCHGWRGKPPFHCRNEHDSPLHGGFVMWIAADQPVRHSQRHPSAQHWRPEITHKHGYIN